MPVGVSDGSIKGDGKGSNVVITYTPGIWANDFTVSIVYSNGPFGLKLASGIKITGRPGRCRKTCCCTR